jgi:hypothetical protein
MQKIVLDSRWCTYGWFRGLSRELLDYAFNLYRTVYATKVDRNALDRLDRLQRKRKDALFLGGLDPSGKYIELIMDPFNLSINVWPYKPDEKDEQNEDICDKAGRWHLQLRGIGSIPFRPAPLRSRYNDSYDDGDPFRSLVNEIVWQIPHVKGCKVNKSDPWEYLEAAMLIAISKRYLHLLQTLLEIHYFFWPDDAPFKLSPRLFAAAARSKCVKVLYLLFQLDPMSFTPTTSKNLFYLAQNLESLSSDHEGIEWILRKHRRRRVATGHLYSEEELRREMQNNCYRKDMGYLDAAVAHYIRTGCPMNKVNSMSPNFFFRTSNLTPVQEICNTELFGCREDGWLPAQANHVCLAERVPANGSNDDQVETWDGSDTESSPDMDKYDDEDEFIDDHDDEESPLDGLAWASWINTMKG